MLGTQYLPSLLALECDQYQRYGAVRAILGPLIEEHAYAERPARILEVGSNVLDLLPQFLEPLPVEVTRCDVIACEGDTSNFVLIERDRPLPFADGEFDYVVALEVLEHIPAEDRLFAVSEWARVARLGLILSCPNGGPAVLAAEELAREAHLERHGTPHAFLTEHEQFGPPTEAEVAKLLDALGLTYQRYGNAPLAEWLAFMLVDEQQLNRRLLERVRHFVNEQRRRFFAEGQTYRQIFYCQHTGDQLPAGEWSNREPLANEPVASNPPASEPPALAGGALPTPSRLWQLEDQLRQLRGKLHVLKRDQERTRQAESRIAELKRELGLARLKLEGGNHRPPTVRHLSPNHELHQLVRDERTGLWESHGGDPRIVWVQPVPAGWCLLHFTGQMLAGSVSQLYFDDGAGFRPDHCIRIDGWNGYASRTLLHVLPVAVRAWRFDPCDEPGHFRLDQLEVRPASKMDVLWHVARLHLCRPSAILGVLRRCLTRWLREGKPGVRHELLKSLLPDVANQAQVDVPPNYAAWLSAHQLSDGERERMRGGIRDAAPRLALVLPVSRVEPAALRRTLASLAEQNYPCWRLHLGARGDDSAECERLLVELPELSPLTTRHALHTAGDAAELLNRVLADEQVDFVIPIEAGDHLSDDALLEVGSALFDQPGIDLLYTDEGHWTVGGGYCGPYCKPCWSPETFVARPYTGRLAAYRTVTCRGLGGFRTDTSGAHEYELLLRLARPDGKNVVHLPRILYHREGFPPRPHVPLHGIRHVWEAGLGRQPGGERSTLDAAQSLASGCPRFTPTRTPAISIVIPTAGRAASIRGRATHFVRHCVESIRRLSTYLRYEIVVVDNADLDAGLREELDALEVRRISFTGPFNLAAKLNRGVEEARGELIVLLNDDTEVITPDWLEAMLEYGCRSEIGAVGAKLRFPDGRLQHTGVLLLADGPSHPWYLAPGEHEGYFRSIAFPRNFLAVTGACLMTRRGLFQRLGGFDVRFPVNYNDVDYCLRVQEAGLRVVYTPFAELYHFEAVSKEGGATVRPEEAALFRQLWGERYPCDPFYSPNLSARHCDYRLGVPGERTRGH
jgi:GT2 family glycosyltransferase/SAM-dependent methyltransferase